MQRHRELLACDLDSDLDRARPVAPAQLLDDDASLAVALGRSQAKELHAVADLKAAVLVFVLGAPSASATGEGRPLVVALVRPTPVDPRFCNAAA